MFEPWAIHPPPPQTLKYSCYLYMVCWSYDCVLCYHFQIHIALILLILWLFYKCTTTVSLKTLLGYLGLFFFYLFVLLGFLFIYLFYVGWHICCQYNGIADGPCSKVKFEYNFYLLDLINGQRNCLYWLKPTS